MEFYSVLKKNKSTHFVEKEKLDGTGNCFKQGNPDSEKQMSLLLICGRQALMFVYV